MGPRWPKCGKIKPCHRIATSADIDNALTRRISPFPHKKTARAMAKSSPRKKPTKSPKLGVLPEWNLDDLYPGLDSPELKWDLENAETRCRAFEADFKGKLAALGAGPDAGKRPAARGK